MFSNCLLSLPLSSRRHHSRRLFKPTHARCLIQHSAGELLGEASPLCCGSSSIQDRSCSLPQSGWNLLKLKKSGTVHSYMCGVRVTALVPKQESSTEQRRENAPEVCLDADLLSLNTLIKKKDKDRPRLHLKLHPLTPPGSWTALGEPPLDRGCKNLLEKFCPSQKRNPLPLWIPNRTRIPQKRSEVISHPLAYTTAEPARCERRTHMRPIWERSWP